eukprot:GHVH01007850.1.p1 GENE.GHVH01007850.1~~GHVH01007850.1.p1  ORF type:complete len:1500 (-),score=241.43 GHVH01007850.1:355-4854(-)
MEKLDWLTEYEVNYLKCSTCPAPPTPDSLLLTSRWCSYLLPGLSRTYRSTLEKQNVLDRKSLLDAWRTVLTPDSIYNSYVEPKDATEEDGEALSNVVDHSAAAISIRDYVHHRVALDELIESTANHNLPDKARQKKRANTKSRIERIATRAVLDSYEGFAWQAQAVLHLTATLRSLMIQLGANMKASHTLRTHSGSGRNDGITTGRAPPMAVPTHPSVKDPAQQTMRDHHIVPDSLAATPLKSSHVSHFNSCTSDEEVEDTSGEWWHVWRHYVTSLLFEPEPSIFPTAMTLALISDAISSLIIKYFDAAACDKLIRRNRNLEDWNAPEFFEAALAVPKLSKTLNDLAYLNPECKLLIAFSQESQGRLLMKLRSKTVATSDSAQSRINQMCGSSGFVASNLSCALNTPLSSSVSITAKPTLHSDGYLWCLDSFEVLRERLLQMIGQMSRAMSHIYRGSSRWNRDNLAMDVRMVWGALNIRSALGASEHHWVYIQSILRYLAIRRADFYWGNLISDEFLRHTWEVKGELATARLGLLSQPSLYNFGHVLTLMKLLIREGVSDDGLLNFNAQLFIEIQKETRQTIEYFNRSHGPLTTQLVDDDYDDIPDVREDGDDSNRHIVNDDDIDHHSAITRSDSTEELIEDSVESAAGQSDCMSLTSFMRNQHENGMLGDAMSSEESNEIVIDGDPDAGPVEATCEVDQNQTYTKKFSKVKLRLAENHLKASCIYDRIGVDDDDRSVTMAEPHHASHPPSAGETQMSAAEAVETGHGSRAQDALEYKLEALGAGIVSASQAADEEGRITDTGRGGKVADEFYRRGLLFEGELVEGPFQALRNSTLIASIVKNLSSRASPVYQQQSSNPQLRDKMIDLLLALGIQTAYERTSRYLVESTWKENRLKKSIRGDRDVWMEGPFLEDESLEHDSEFDELEEDARDEDYELDYYGVPVPLQDSGEGSGLVFSHHTYHGRPPPTEDMAGSSITGGEWDEEWQRAEDHESSPGGRDPESDHLNDDDDDEDEDDRVYASTVRTEETGRGEGIFTGGFTVLKAKADVANTLKRTEKGRLIKRKYRVNLKKYEIFTRAVRQDLIELTRLIGGQLLPTSSLVDSLSSSSSGFYINDSGVQFERFLYDSSCLGEAGAPSGPIADPDRTLGIRPRVFRGPAALVALTYMEIEVLKHPVWGPGIGRGGLYGSDKEGVAIAKEALENHQSKGLNFFEGGPLLDVLRSRKQDIVLMPKLLLRWIIYQAASDPARLGPWTVSLLKRQYYTSLALSSGERCSLSILNAMLWMPSLGMLLPVMEFLRELLVVHKLHLIPIIVRGMTDQIRGFVDFKILENTFFSYVVCETFYYYLEHYGNQLYFASRSVARSKEVASERQDTLRSGYWNVVIEWARELLGAFYQSSNDIVYSSCSPREISREGSRGKRGGKSVGDHPNTSHARTNTPGATEFVPLLGPQDRIDSLLLLSQEDLLFGLKSVLEAIVLKAQSIETILKKAIGPTLQTTG